MDGSKYEKSLDNRSAALVSRERRAPRATDECKSFEFNALESTHSTQAARGAQVSRAARGHIPHFIRPISRPVHRALLSHRGVAGTTPSSRRRVGCHTDVTPCQTNVPECPRCDIPRCIHKPILRNGLDLELQASVIRFRELCDILRHFETWF